MDAADDLELKWIHLDPAQAGAGAGADPDPGSGSGPGSASGSASRGDAHDHPPIDRHDLGNAITAIVGAARLLCDRWDELGEPERRELASMVKRRAEALRRTLEGRRDEPEASAGE